jgi:hypothetical protein
MAKRLQSRTVFWAAAVICLFVIGIQFIRPELTNPRVTADLQAPPEVKHILQKSCYNCHSNETKVPWFDEVAPAYWLVASDVKEARAHQNFSEFGKLPDAQQTALFYDAVNKIQLGAMPLPSYRRVHPGSAVTPEELAALRAYFTPAEPIRPAGPAGISAADAQYETWGWAGSK